MLTGDFLFLAASVQADMTAPLNQVIFTEILPGTASSASQEFIEIYNNTDSDVDLAGWHIQYASATKSDWTSPSRNITLTGTIRPKDYYMLATTGYLTDVSNLSYSATLAQTGGHLRILDDTAGTQDQIGWGDATMALGSPVNAPALGSSMARLTNENGYNLTEDNGTDWAATLTPTPLADNVVTLPASEDDNSDGGDGEKNDNPSTPPVKVEYPLIQISELLPNPAAPQTDGNDEYVELYNPGDSDVDLTGYVITTGLNATYKYAIKDVTIPAGGYQVFTSGNTNLSLSNSAGKAQLLAPDGSLMSETDPYDNAGAGQAWIIDNGVWTWTITPTSGQDNILTAPPHKTATIKKATTKVAKAKTSKVKAPKKVKARSKKATTPLASVSPPPTNTKIHPGVLAGVGSSALLYALYEYRNDLANGVYRARRYRDTRRPLWPAFEATRGSRAARRFGRWQDHVRRRLGTRLKK